MQKERKRLDKREALLAMQRYCAYQDRCHKEVRTRLIEHQVYGDDLEDIIVALIDEDFLNEERYARSYARGKFRIKKWGKLKIVNDLKYNQISRYCINKGLSEIEDKEYENTLKEVLLKKLRIERKLKGYALRQKLYAHAARKGYESHLISNALNEILDESPKKK